MCIMYTHCSKRNTFCDGVIPHSIIQIYFFSDDDDSSDIDIELDGDDDRDCSSPLGRQSPPPSGPQPSHSTVETSPVSESTPTSPTTDSDPQPGSPTRPSDKERPPRPSHPSSIPTAFRPGRLSTLEILERIFPYQKRTVLELVLQGCAGDLVKAIEHFLSAQDTIMAQQQQQQQQQRSANHPTPAHSHDPPVPGMPDNRLDSHSVTYHPYMTSLSHHFRPPVSGLSGPVMPGKLGLSANLKSAFTPLAPGHTYLPLHSAFSPRAAAFTTDALLGRTPSVHTRGPDLLPTPPPFSYPTLTSLQGHMPGLAPSLFLPSYRLATDLTDKAEGSLTAPEVPRSPESWGDRSPGKESKDSDWFQQATLWSIHGIYLQSISQINKQNFVSKRD